MAEINNVLGISGQLNIEDILASINTLSSNLDKIGVDVQELSQKWNDSLKEIANSTETNLEQKITSATAVMKSAVEEGNKSLSSMPNAIKKNEEEIESFQKVCDTLREKLKSVDKGSIEYNNLNTQLKHNAEALQQAKDKAQELNDAYIQIRQTTQYLQGGADVLSTVTKGAGITATVGQTSASTAEAGAHAANASAISGETEARTNGTQKINDSIEATQKQTLFIVQQTQSLNALKETEKEINSELEKALELQNKSKYGEIVEKETAAARRSKQNISEYQAQKEENPQYSKYYDSFIEKENQRLEEHIAKAQEAKEKDEDLQRTIRRIYGDLSENKEQQEEVKSGKIPSFNIKGNEDLGVQYDAILEKVKLASNGIDEFLEKSNAAAQSASALKEEIADETKSYRVADFGSGENTFNGISEEIGIDAKKALYDDLQSKINEYGETVATQSANIEAAYQQQTLIIQGLSDTYSALKEQKDKALADGDVAKVADIDTKMQSLSEVIEQQSQKLATLKTQANIAKEALRNINEEKEKMSQGVERGGSFFGTLIDGASGVKEKISQALSGVADAVSSKLEPVKEKVKDVGEKLSELASKANSKIGFDRLGEAITDTKGKIADFADKVADITGLSKFKESIGEAGKALEAMGIPLGAARKGVALLNSAFAKLILNPVGAVLAVIVLGLKAVHTWMTKSAEGQKVYTKLMAYFASLAATVTDLVITLGSWLYRCFADANGPLRDFGNNLINTFKSAGKAVIGILSGIGTSLKGILTRDWETFTDGQKKLWDGLKNTGATIVNAVKTSVTGTVGVLRTAYNALTNNDLHNKLGNILNGALTRASQAAAIAGKQQEAEIAIGKAKKTQAELDIKIAENKEKIYQLTGKEKIALIEETKALQRQRYDGILDAQKKMLSYQQQRMKLHTNSLQDIAKERELSTDILRTEAQRAASTRMLTRQEEAARRSLERQDKSAAKTEANEAKKKEKQNEQTRAANNKYDEILYNNDNAREKTIVDLEGKIADARVAAMKEGFSKTQAERKRQQEKELQQLQEQEEAAVAAELKRVKAEFDAQNAIRKARGQSTLTWNADKEAESIENTSDVKAIRKAYSELRQLTVGRQVEDERKAADELIKSHQSYTDRKLAIDKQYQIDLQAIDNAIKEAQSRNDQEQVSALQRTRNQRTVDYAKDKMQAAFDELKNSPDYVAAFTDIDKASTETLTKLIQRFEEVKGAAAASLNPQDAKTYFDTVNSLIDELISRDPVGMIRQLSEELRVQQQELTDSLEELRKAQELLNNVQNGRKDITTVKSWRADVVDGQIKMTPEYYTLAEAQEKVAKAEEHVATAGQQVARSQKQIEKASEKTLNEVSKLISAFNQVGNAIGGEAGQIINLISDIGNFAISSANAMMSVSTTASKAIQTLEKASAILTIISGAISIMSKVSSLFKTSDDYYQKYAKRQAAINSLRDSVNEYRLSVIKAQQAEKNWFATTGLQNLKDSWEQHTQIIKEYRDKLLEPQEIYKDKGAGLKKLAVPALAAAAVVAGVFTAGLGTAAIGALAGTLGGTLVTTAAVAGASAAVGWIAGSGIQSGVDSITYKRGQTAAINNLRIQTRHRTAFRSEKTADLRDWVRDNYGEDLFTQDEETGMLLINADLAQKVIDEKGGKLKGQTKETLEKLIELRKEYDKFEEDLKDYVSETYSPIVDNMTDAIWAWLSEGKDALQEFKESASKTFADIGKEMIKQMLLKEVFGTFQDDLYKLYRKYATGEVDLNQLTEQMSVIMGTTVDKFENSLPAVETFAEKYRDIMANLGFDVTGNQEQNASSKGVSTITYDQANFLVNLGTARNIALEQGNAVRQLIQLDTSQLKITTMQIQSDISVMRDIQEQGLTQITRIEVNTRPIRDILTVVQDIYRITKDNA